MATHMWSRVLLRNCNRISRQNLRRRFSSTSGSGGGDSVPFSTVPAAARVEVEEEDSLIGSVPLDEPLPGFPTPIYASAGRQKHETIVTTLDNGLKVATEKKFGQFCTVGVVIDSGSRYEVAYPSGISHFLEKLSFGKTTEFQHTEDIFQELEKHGGICDCQGSRDTLIYAMSAESTGLESVTNILSEVINRRDISEDEMEACRAAVGFELEGLQLNPNPEPLLMEMIHAAAYRDNTLGLPKFCPAENISKIDTNILYTYMKNFHIPERMVLAGIGIEHDSLVELAQKYFVEKKPIWADSAVIDPKMLDSSKGVDKSLAQYTGGMKKVEADLSNVALGINPMPELAHFVIGLESSSHKDDDFVAFCVLNMMMGGGGSFSAGGPGKGMYTRLYLNVLNRFHWIHSATAYNHAYEDSGLFCIHASSNPKQLRDLVQVILQEIINTAGDIDTEELERAKIQLQSMLLMNLESRPVVFEDAGRQVLANNVRKQPEYFCDQIARISNEDIQRVAERMLKTKPSVAAYGTLSKLPDYDDIESAIRKKSGKLPRRFSLYR